MPLHAIPENPIPPGSVEHSLVAADGVKLRAAAWTPPGARGTIALLGGRTEYIEKYFETIGDLLARGFAVATMDWRGQGGSERQLGEPMKGHIDDFSLYARDFAAFETEVLAGCPRPWIGLCHSMGGAIMLMIAHDGGCPFERLIVTAPMIGLSQAAVPPFLQPLAAPRVLRGIAEIVDGLGLGGAFAPGGGAEPLGVGGFAGNPLTSDPARYERLSQVLKRHRQIGLGGPTVGWVHAAFRLMREFENPDYPRAISVPTLVIASGADRVVEVRAIERFAVRLSAGNLIVVDGARHEIMMERDLYRAQFFAAFDAYAGGTVAFTPPYRAAV